MNYFTKKIIAFILLVSATLFSVFPQNTFAQVAGSGNASGGFNIQGVGAVAASCIDLPGLISDGINAIGNALGFGGNITDPASAAAHQGSQDAQHGERPLDGRPRPARRRRPHDVHER